MNETEWYSNRRTLVFSFLFAVGFHAALFAFVHHFPSFGKLKPVSPPKLTVHLCVKAPVKVVYDVRQIKPASFFPEVPPPPKKVVPKKPKKVAKPKVVKKPPKKAIHHVKKKTALPPVPRKTKPEPQKAEEAWVERTVKSTVPSTYAPRVATPPAEPTEAPTTPGPPAPPAPPKRELAYPDYGKNPALIYPILARRRGIEGKVILKVLVSKTGRPLKVVLERSSGSSILDHAAMKAVRKWFFKPGKLNGKAVEMWVRVPVVYRLK